MKPFSRDPAGASLNHLTPRLKATVLGLTLVASVTAQAAATNAPQINLFPSNVIESLKQTSNSARNLETSLSDIIATLERQTRLYQESRCEGAVADQGCNELKKTMVETYMNLLDTVEGELPAMRRAFNETVVTIEKRIREQIGQGLTPRGIQRLVAGKSEAARVAQRTSGKRLGRMSETFNRWVSLVSRNRSAGSIPTMAADIYLDSVQAQSYIDLLEDEIQVARMEAMVIDSYSGITPEMTETVSRVKSLIYGEMESPMAVEPVVAQAKDPNTRALIIE